MKTENKNKREMLNSTEWLWEQLARANSETYKYKLLFVMALIALFIFIVFAMDVIYKW